MNMEMNSNEFVKKYPPSQYMFVCNSNMKDEVEKFSPYEIAYNDCILNDQVYIIQKESNLYKRESFLFREE